MSGTVVLDSSNLEAIIADATGEGLAKPAEAETPAPAAEAAPEPKAAETAAEKTEEAEEDENGLTADERKDLTAKMQKAIGKKHRALKEAEEFAAEQYNERRLAEGRAEQYEREVKRLQAQLGQQPEKPAEDGRPKRENFETDDAFRDALVDWQVDQRLMAKEAEDTKKREEARQAEIIEQARSRIARAIELVPDFQEVTEAADLTVPPVIAGYMQESEMFAELGYHFAKNPEVLERLAKLAPTRALVEIGKIESTLKPFAPASGSETPAKVENGEQPSAAKPSPANGAKPSPETGSTPSKPRAPAPITPISAGSGRQVEKDEGEMDVREVIAKWSKDKRVNLSRRQRH